MPREGDVAYGIADTWPPTTCQRPSRLSQIAVMRRAPLAMVDDENHAQAAHRGLVGSMDPAGAALLGAAGSTLPCT